MEEISEGYVYEIIYSRSDIGENFILIGSKDEGWHKNINERKFSDEEKTNKEINIGRGVFSDRGNNWQVKYLDPV